MREATDLEDSIQRERSRYLQLRQSAFDTGNTVKAQEYARLFNEFRREEDEKRIRTLQTGFMQSYHSPPWSLMNLLMRSSYTPADTLETYYSRLDTPTRNSHYGVLLRKKIDDMIRLLPGQPAPDFSVTLPNGTVMDSEKFRKKYLLIYHWGFCPGSIQREKDATELYNRFKDHFEILGITVSLDAIKEAAQTTPPDAEFEGINLRTTYESMSVHPWIDIEDGTDGNHKISEMYAFAGFPYFILISPDGKIVSRGFHETFFEAKEILENQYDKK
ncbi:MAG: peroxiredoxin family protein [Bacteroidales bacterium]|nr:peroxiredoxin family protein [Bacteroidales bacterium]